MRGRQSYRMMINYFKESGFMADLSIIVVCYRGWSRLIKCLEALSLFSGYGFSTEVIVVDNNSDDDTINDIKKRFSAFKFIMSDVNGGFGNACNKGANNSNGKFLLFLNPDTVAEESEVEKLLAVAQKTPAYTILSCRQVNERGKECIVSGEFPHLFNLTGFQRSIFGRGDLRKSQNYEPIIFPDWVSGSVILIRKKYFEQLNGFDEDFWMYYEDVDICKRVHNTGGKVALLKNITIEHNHGGSSRVNLKTASITKTEVLISKHLYISKHKKGLNAAIIQTFLIVNNIVSLGLIACPGLVMFFIPKLFSRTLIFLRLLYYYLGSVINLSWISQRSINYRINK